VNDNPPLVGGLAESISTDERREIDFEGPKDALEDATDDSNTVFGGCCCAGGGIMVVRI
jgi:hypothetical protein